ncbi:hypothetical protein [Sphingomonas endolithica]|uniref:hypothetical protein n=1 Tax=Sphingomonas endolithica TaxID=2972485 RepID=UPI0021AF2C9D|nr:hypothetical protein [Sphingomonas sp. ZFBP2030]
MAYLDLDNMFPAPLGSRGTTPAPAPGPSGFTALEWSVIALAKNDTIGSLATPGRVSRALGGVFGLSTASRLADPKLEALRRMAVHAWRRGFALPMAEINRFIAAGFGEAQMETLVASVTGLRVAANGRSA